MKTLIFIEERHQIEKALSAAESQLDNHKIIALTPEVEYALEKKGMPFSIPDNYYQEDELVQLGMDNYNHLDGFCEYINEYLLENSPILKRYNLPPEFSFHYHFKILLDAVTSKIFITKKVVEKEYPDRVIFFNTQRESFSCDLFFIKESVYSRVIPIVSKHLNIDTIGLEEKFEDILDNLSDVCSKAGFIEKALIKLMGKDGKNILSFINNNPDHIRTLFNKKDKKTILILKRGYSVEYVIKECKKRGDYKLIFWNHSLLGFLIFLNPFRYFVDKYIMELFKIEVKELWSKLKNEKRFKQYFVWSGIDYFEIVKSRLEFFFTKCLPEEILNIYLKAKKVFSVYRPSMVFTSMVNGYIDKTIAFVGRKKGIPIVEYIHGPLGQSSKTMMPYSVDGVDYFLTFGEGDRDCVNEAKRDKQVMPIPVGSAVLDSLRKKVMAKKGELYRRFNLDPDRKIVAYVLTIFGGQGRNIIRLPDCKRSDSRYFYMQKMILSIFKDYPDIQFIIKLFPNPLRRSPLTAEFVMDKSISNCTVVDNGSLMELIPLVDMFIIDNPSTPFQEMLTTRKNILVYDDVHFMDKEDVIDMIRKRAFYTNDFDEFLATIRDYLTNERFESIENPDQEFLQLYGTHLNDGRSAQRAVEAIDWIIEKHRQKIALRYQ